MTPLTQCVFLCYLTTLFLQPVPTFAEQPTIPVTLDVNFDVKPKPKSPNPRVEIWAEITGTDANGKPYSGFLLKIKGSATGEYYLKQVAPPLQVPVGVKKLKIVYSDESSAYRFDPDHHERDVEKEIFLQWVRVRDAMLLRAQEAARPK